MKRSAMFKVFSPKIVLWICPFVTLVTSSLLKVKIDVTTKNNLTSMKLKLEK